jgi:hypothetical protein
MMMQMPVVAINLSPLLFVEVDELVKAGLYSGPEQFLEIAAFNQLALERGASPEAAVTRSGASRDTPEAKPLGRVPRKTRDRRKVAAAGRRKNTSTPVAKRDLEASLKRAALPSTDALPPSPPAVVRPREERVWGQVNRLFPLKLACRWIANTSEGRGAWRTIDFLADAIADDAATIGSALEVVDRNAQRKRDDLLSTALPRRSNSASRGRFLTQYLARTTRSGDIYPGAVCQFALAHFDGDSLALTDRGVRLAFLENPILDGDLIQTTETLSPEERAFFLDQVVRFVPGERRDAVVVGAAIANGGASPTSLLEAVRPALPEQWSNVMVRTQVSGTLARMCDLGVVVRHWQGRRVTYELTDRFSVLRDSEARESPDR